MLTIIIRHNLGFETTDIKQTVAGIVNGGNKRDNREELSQG